MSVKIMLVGSRENKSYTGLLKVVDYKKTRIAGCRAPALLSDIVTEADAVV